MNPKNNHDSLAVQLKDDYWYSSIVMIFVRLIGDNFCDNVHFFFFYWSKIIEREIKKENKNTMWVWERNSFESCYKMVVKISFLLQYQQTIFHPTRVGSVWLKRHKEERKREEGNIEERVIVSCLEWREIGKRD